MLFMIPSSMHAVNLQTTILAARECLGNAGVDVDVDDGDDDDAGRG